jgi:GT2 family glycosyltransferase
MKLNWLARLLPWMRRYYADLGAGQRQPLRVDQVMGAMMLVPSQLMTEVGWFDEGYPNWFEEVDLCQRIYRHGCEVWYVPTVSMLHHGGSSFGQVLSIKKHRWFIAGIRRYAKKFWPRWQSKIIDILAPISYGLTVLQSLVKPR